MKRINSSIMAILIGCLAIGLFPSCDEDDIPGEILDLLPRGFYEELVENGFVMNLGEAPPSVEGIYLFQPENQYDNSGAFDPGDIALDTKWKFENQSGNDIDVSIKGWTGIGLVDVSDATIVKGDGSKFTIFAQAFGESGGIDYVYDYVLSGELNASGIQNAQFAFVMIDNPGAATVASTGTIRIFKDADDIASNTAVFRTLEGEAPAGIKSMLAR